MTETPASSSGGDTAAPLVPPRTVPTPVALTPRPVTSVGPRAVERPADAGHTQIRILDDPTPALLDHAGGLAPAGVDVMVDWWIGADDRWYFPSKEATIRQRRLGPGPVIETAMRIPSGDAVHRCYAVSSPKGAATVIEVNNASPVPVALAIAIRSYGIDGTPTGSHSVRLEGQSILVDDTVVVELPRRPNEAEAADTDLFRRVVEGHALTGPTSAAGDDANLVVLYPLPHTTTLRFVVPGPEGAVPPHLPELEQVQRGWATLLEPGGRFVFPDAGLGDRADAARVRILGAAIDLPDHVANLEPGAGRLLEALAVSGSARDCSYALGALSSAFPVRLPHAPAAAAAVVAGGAKAAAVIGDAEAATSLLEPLMQITHLVERSGDRPAAADALGGLSLLLRLIGQHDAADDVARSIPSGLPVGDLPDDLGALTALSEAASSTGSWGNDELEPAVRFWLGARRQMIDDAIDAVAILPRFPTAWRGGNLEVHRAATVAGPLSFAIRWHGARPALLWDLDNDDPGVVTLSCPGLDPGWTTTDRRGETLLVGASSELPPVPDEGDSFS
ncbi:MAG: hypothetical protein R2710_17110 [Acidimicrobiales bacterium]